MKRKTCRKLAIASFVSSKGGVGKSTTALNLAVAFAKKGHAVTLIDTDPQATTSKFFPVSNVSLRDVLQRRAPLSKARRGVRENLSLLASTRELDDMPFAAWAQFAPICEQIANSGDIVIIDTPAGWRDITRAAASVSTLCIVPLKPAMPDYEAAVETLDLLNGLQRPPTVRPLQTFWRENATSRLIAAQRGDWFRTSVPDRASFNMCALQSQSVFDQPQNPLSPIFEALATEIGVEINAGKTTG